MKKIGYLMITIGFLAGSLTAVIDQSKIRWDFFAAALVLGITGVIIVRLDEKQKSSSAETIVSNMQNIQTSLARITENIALLNTQAETINTYDVRHRIDELFIDDINTFVDARKSITQKYGLQAYADIMSYFAIGERYLNRVWSASADGYINEVATYLKKAQTQFTQALEKVNQLKEPTL